MLHRLRPLILPFLAILAATLLFHGLTSGIPDPDSFYHLRHSWLYRTTTLLDTAFPWTYYSSIRTLGGDIWYGFHILLIPLTYFRDLVTGIKVGGVLFTLTLLSTVLWIAKRHKFAMSYFWPLFFFLAIPNVLFQYLMVRPHVLSLAFAMLLLSFFARGKWWHVLLASTAITFFHLGFFWIGPFIALAVLSIQVAAAIVKKIQRTNLASIPIGWLNALLVFFGTALGALLRPHPIAAAKLAYIQIIKLLFEKTGGAPLSFGRELAPLPIGELATTSTIFLILWVASLVAIAVAYVNFRERWNNVPASERLFLLSTAAISGAFFILTALIARRSLVQWEAFGALMIAATYTHLFSQKAKEYALGVLAIAFVVMIPYAVYRHNLNVRYTTFPYEWLKGASEWLNANSAPGEVVFNTHWDNFAPLFFRNQKNYYLGGMDPIFQYDYSPQLYWKFYYLSKDLMTAQTCGAYPCSDGAREDTYTVLTRDFNAKYILVEPWRNPKLTAYLSGDARYKKVFEAKTEQVFRVKR
ncbi:MAG: hypothetical protein HYT82_02325 [Candidatus Harrisonbacteria bacterium]|nr:hypothetical protein [Candidatus Harrisonbacteria bacterium]